MSKVVPEGWQLLELDDVTDKILGGGTPSRLEPSYWNGDIPWVSVKDLSGTRLTDTEESITSEGLANSASRLIPANTAILATRMAVGKLAYFDRAVAINQDLKAFFPKKNLDWKFFLQWYLSKSETIAGLATGSTVKGIRLEDLRSLPIKLPPFSEQQKIATILSSVDNVIEKTRTQIDKLKDLKTGMMQELLTKGIGHTEFKDSVLGRIPRTWKVTTLGAITESSAFGPRFSSSYYSDDGNVGCIRTTDMDDEWCIDYKTVPLALLKESEFREHFLIDGDLLVTRSGTCGVVDVFQGQLVPMVAAAFLIRFRLSDYVNPWFVKYLMASSSTQKNIQLLASGGVQKNLSGSSLKTLQIAMPSRFEQDGIVKIINSINIKIKVLRQENSGLEVLKKALVQSLLTGKTQVTFMV